MIGGGIRQQEAAVSTQESPPSTWASDFLTSLCQTRNVAKDVAQ